MIKLEAYFTVRYLFGFISVFFISDLKIPVLQHYNCYKTAYISR